MNTATPIQRRAHRIQSRNAHAHALQLWTSVWEANGRRACGWQMYRCRKQHEALDTATETSLHQHHLSLSYFMVWLLFVNVWHPFITLLETLLTSNDTSSRKYVALVVRTYALIVERLASYIQKTYVRFSEYFKLSVGVNVSVNGCFIFILYDDDKSRVHPSSCPSTAGDRLQHTRDPSAHSNRKWRMNIQNEGRLGTILLVRCDVFGNCIAQMGQK